MYTHLIIGGGGVKGMAIIGALEALSKNGILDGITHYLGSSIGGLICFLLTIGYTYSELFDITMKLDFSKYKDIDITNIFDTWGLDSCKLIMNIIKIMAKQKGINSEITFEELYNETGKCLTLTGSNILTNQDEYYSHIESPKKKVFDAIRITICYPIIFYPFRGENGIIIDGAFFMPYPMKYYQNVKTKIGIIIHNRHSYKKIETAEDYLLSMLSCLQERYEKTFMEGYEKDTIIIDIKTIHSMNLDITNDDKLIMYKIGKQCVEKFMSSSSSTLKD